MVPQAFCFPGSPFIPQKPVYTCKRRWGRPTGLDDRRRLRSGPFHISARISRSSVTVYQENCAIPAHIFQFRQDGQVRIKFTRFDTVTDMLNDGHLALLIQCRTGECRQSTEYQRIGIQGLGRQGASPRNLKARPVNAQGCGRARFRYPRPGAGSNRCRRAGPRRRR